MRAQTKSRDQVSRNCGGLIFLRIKERQSHREALELPTTTADQASGCSNKQRRAHESSRAPGPPDHSPASRSHLDRASPSGRSSLALFSLSQRHCRKPLRLALRRANAKIASLRLWPSRIGLRRFMRGSDRFWKITCGGVQQGQFPPSRPFVGTFLYCALARNVEGSMQGHGMGGRCGRVVGRPQREGCCWDASRKQRRRLRWGQGSVRHWGQAETSSIRSRRLLPRLHHGILLRNSRG
jgi:hypothetical protein